MQEADHLKEAERLMTVCNSCRYCEGLCAVFPAMELRRSFEKGDLNYLANLCHNCNACYVDCQFAPPHDFNVNVPKTLAALRVDSYQAHAWPKAMQPMFERNGLAIALVTALSIAAFILGFVLWHDPAVLTSDDGRFYRLMPHNVMASLFGAVALYAVLALAMSFRLFWIEIGAGSVSAASRRTLWQAVKDAARLRYLDGGGVGCYNEDEKPDDRRKLYHHLTFYGFLLCFAATTTGTIYHYVLDWPAPYGWASLPKLFGIPGGLGLVIGTLGLFHEKQKRDPQMVEKAQFGMETAFLLMLFLSGLTGLLLMVLGQTAAMGVMLAIHLGVVFALFLTMPYGKFIHGFFRFAALALYAAERKAGLAARPGANS